MEKESKERERTVVVVHPALAVRRRCGHGAIHLATRLVLLPFNLEKPYPILLVGFTPSRKEDDRAVASAVLGNVGSDCLPVLVILLTALRRERGNQLFCFVGQNNHLLSPFCLWRRVGNRASP